MEGRAFDNDSGKLLCQTSVRSETYADDKDGRMRAVAQAARRLATELVPRLESAISSLGRGRKVMVQLQAGERVLSRLEQVSKLLVEQVGKVSVLGASSRSLVVLVEYKRPSKELAAKIEAVLSGLGGMRIEWQLVADSALIGKLYQPTD